MAPRLTSFTTSAALLCLLLVLLPQSIVGFAISYKNPRTVPACGISYKTSKLLQSSRVLPSDDASVSLPPFNRVVQNLQERLATYRHVRQQKKLIHAEQASNQGFVPVVQQFLYKPNKMLLQGFILAHQQAQYDHLHPYHDQSAQIAIQSARMPTVRLSFAQRRRDAKNARLAAKYAAMESLEDRAFQICKDLGMI